MKAAIAKVAAAQNHSVSYVITQVLTEWLEANGHLLPGNASDRIARSFSGLVTERSWSAVGWRAQELQGSVGWNI